MQLENRTLTAQLTTRNNGKQPGVHVFASYQDRLVPLERYEVNLCIGHLGEFIEDFDGFKASGQSCCTLWVSDITAAHALVALFNSPRVIEIEAL